MVISELIEELKKIKKKHGDLLVDIKAQYDGSYYAGCDVDSINVTEVRRWEPEPEAPCGEISVEKKAVQLTSYEYW